MYSWRYEDGKELTQWDANSMPCNHHPCEGNCKAPYCKRWRSLNKLYYITEKGDIKKAELLELVSDHNIGWCS